jgi:hypothetical protein
MKIRLALATTAAVLLAAVVVYFVAGTPRAESHRIAQVEPQGTPALACWSGGRARGGMGKVT